MGSYAPNCVQVLRPLRVGAKFIVNFPPPDPDDKYIQGLIQENNGAKIKVQLNKDKSVGAEGR